MKKTTPIIILIIFSVAFSSCRTNTLSKKEKQIQREKKRRVKEDTVLYEKALKKHMKNQTKATRQEMKRNYREAQRHNNQKQEFFLKRFVREKLYQRQKKQKG